MLSAPEVVPLVEWVVRQEGPVDRGLLTLLVASTPGWAPAFDWIASPSRLVGLALSEAQRGAGPVSWDAATSSWASGGSGLSTATCPAPPRRPPSPPCLGAGAASVYAIYAPTDRYDAARRGLRRWPVKIGRTSRSPATRLAELQVGSRLPLTLGLVLRTDRPSEVEATLHAQLATHRIDGPSTEWFLTSLWEVRDAFLVALGRGS